MGMGSLARALGVLLVLIALDPPRLAPAQQTPPFTAGIDRCDNARIVPLRARKPSYRIATGEVELPLVFAPGLGWFRTRLDPAGAGQFTLRDAEPTCEDHPQPATYVARLGEVRIPDIEAVDERGAVLANYDATLMLDPARGVFTVTRLGPAQVRSTLRTSTVDSAPGRRRALADAQVQGVELAAPPIPYESGERLPLSRISGGRIGGPEAGCAQNHLHGTIMIDGTGPHADPNPGGCGHGVIVLVDPDVATAIVNVPVAESLRNCGPDITSAFFGRLRAMSTRLAALSDAEKGTFDGTMFLARNGANIDFEVNAIRNPASSKVCPTQSCEGDGFVSTVTLCGRCVMSHVDNDIQYGVVAEALRVPVQVQIAGAAGWDLFMRGGIDPPASVAAYALGNALARTLAANPTASNTTLCGALTSTTYRTVTFTDVPVADIFSEELTGFGKDSCQPCRHGCPEILVRKDFSGQSWSLDRGRVQVPRGGTRSLDPAS